MPTLLIQVPTIIDFYLTAEANFISFEAAQARHIERRVTSKIMSI